MVLEALLEVVRPLLSVLTIVSVLMIVLGWFSRRSDGDAQASGLAVTGARHDAPGLEAMLPEAVAGRSIARWSLRGMEVYRVGSTLTADEESALVADLASDGVDVDDIEMAIAGRSDVETQPPYFVQALRVKSLPAAMCPSDWGVDHPEAGSWSRATFGSRVVRVGTETMVDQTVHMRGRPYVYDAGDVRFVVTTDDDAWAAEALARICPDPIDENASLFVTLPPEWRPGLSPTVADEARAEARASGVLAAAHDGSMLDRDYVPTLVIEFTGARLEGDVASALDRHESDVRKERELDPGVSASSVERVHLPSGKAVRLDEIRTVGEPPVEVAGIRFTIAAAAGAFDLFFSCAASDLPRYEATVKEMAGTFMQADIDPGSALARLARGELTRQGYEWSAARLD